MDALDEQLAQLKLINSRTLSSTDELLSGRDHSPKKVAPAVPPKPNKKNFPQVPQSSVVKQICEPNYSKRLQTEGGGGNGAQQRSTAGIIQQNRLAGNASHHLYSNMKMTLDNPAILEQQLEALEHHKKQLEKRGMLPSSGGAGVLPIKQQTQQQPTPQSVSPRPASSHLYSNIKHAKGDSDSEIVYSNIVHLSKIPAGSKDAAPPDDLVYSNVGFGNAAEELPPPPPIESIPPPPLTLVENSAFDYLNQASEDELPPPPSPVSSSYSELRRATDNFPQMPSYPMQAYTSGGSSGPGLCGHPQIGHTNGSNSSQQTYINTSYQNDYSTYGLSSQSTPNSSDYYGYGSSQGSSTYESIYEPINPRPPSQLSSRSNYSLYTSYVNGPQSAASGGGGTPVGGVAATIQNGAPNGGGGTSNKLANHKEAEVEVLTNLLVHSMNSGGDIDTYGICVKCGERVVGENSGCTAMEQIYHITCFTCSQCQINLQGKPFYALEGKPYCEEDYLNTLEKCSVCMKPILERILRATGKPYHPQCFCCIVCGNSLDGIPFTVDATNQNYCIEDFHKKFAPRCCVCRQPIMPEPGQEETVRVVALDRSFHFECYKCEDCGLLLSSEAEGRGCYPLDDHVLCKSCNAKRVQALTSCMTTEL